MSISSNKQEGFLKIAAAILILSCVVLIITAFKYVFKPSEKIIIPTAKKNNSERDSLQKSYNNTIDKIDKDLLTTETFTNDKEGQQKFAEVNNLRAEINTLLKEQNTNGDLSIAKLKIEELQINVALLQNKYSNVASENKRLQAMLDKLLSNSKASSNANNITTATLPTKEKTASNNKKNSSNNAVANRLNFTALTTTNNKDQETNTAEDAEKLIGSFTLKNINFNIANEVMIIVLQPNGKVLKNSVWETGTFETNEGKKIYSKKMYLDNNSDEKLLNFSLSSDSFMQGEYTMQLWYNKIMLAQTKKRLQ